MAAAMFHALHFEFPQSKCSLTMTDTHGSEQEIVGMKLNEKQPVTPAILLTCTLGR